MYVKVRQQCFCTTHDVWRWCQQKPFLSYAAQDLAKDSAPHYKRARRFYDGLAEQLVRQGHALDVFACSLDQACPGCDGTWILPETVFLNQSSLAGFPGFGDANEVLRSARLRAIISCSAVSAVQYSAKASKHTSHARLSHLLLSLGHHRCRRNIRASKQATLTLQHLVAQVGLAEMKPAVEATGGMVVQTDTFLNPVFKESFKRVFAPETEEGYLAVASNATFEVGPALLARLIVLPREFCPEV